ncbi:MAG: RHS repeat-associated core domain-containing protein [Flavobacteriales bacterium]
MGYYPFGMQMPGRKFNGGDYRYGYQGQEQDNEIKGEGNSVNYKYRMHDPRLGRFFAVDPLAPEYPHNSPYAFSENRVIDGVELEGLEWVYYTTVTLLHTGKTVVKTTHFYDKSVTGTIYNYKQKIEGSESEYIYTSNDNQESYNQSNNKMVLDNSSYFKAAGLWHKVQEKQEMQTVGDGIAVAVSLASVIASFGTTSPLVLGFGITTGVASTGLNTKKLVLDLKGDYNESAVLPGGLGEAFGQEFDEFYKEISDSYDGDTFETLGGLAEAVIALKIGSQANALGISDNFIYGGLVASWMLNNDIDNIDFEKYNDEFKEIMKHYKTIDDARKNQ